MFKVYSIGVNPFGLLDVMASSKSWKSISSGEDWSACLLAGEVSTSRFLSSGGKTPPYRQVISYVLAEVQ